MPSFSIPLPDGRQLLVDGGDHALSLLVDDQTLGRAERQGESWWLSAVDLPPAVWALAYQAFASDPLCQRLSLRLDEWPAELVNSGVLNRDPTGAWQVERATFWQLPAPWRRGPASEGYPQRLRITDGKRHPLRPPKPSGELYRRFDARLGSWISFRALDIDTDLERFNRWQNTPRVLHFWQEGGDLAQHRSYLETIAADPHVYSLIGCFDDQPFAYFELYWAREDRIAPFYRVDDYDRGIHMLVGEQAHRGPHKVASWLAALTHYAFLDDPRTGLVVAEPRADNAKMIGYMQTLGYYREKEFDFPHKRAALMAIGRERFFDSGVLC